ncbi:MAG: hypothetical protein RI885_1015 [Actinomycetota bacterium]
MPDPTLILLVVALGAFIVFQIFQGRKRKRETEDRQSKFVVGAEIMTNYGLYGTILSIDDDRNLVEIESTPGVMLKIHRQTILKIADYEEAAAAKALEAAGIDDDTDAEHTASDTTAGDRTTSDGTPSDDTVPDRTSTADPVVPDDASALDEPRFGERVDPKPDGGASGSTNSSGRSGRSAPKADD